MKKLLYLFSIVVLTLTSCSSDDDSNTNTINSQNLLGKWYVKGGTINNGAFENYEHECASSRDFQEFFSNGETTFNGYNTSCELNEIETSNWVLNGATLTISNTNFDPMIYEYSYTIEKLDDNELIIKETVTEPDGTFVYKSTFTRN